ncbi:Translation elongation factor P-lysine lysyltransferase [Sandaracinus amylolyticus]|nr:Translation elongation factor P-lysine lysyltransferase [Sandaracinus amylolyticus]
MIEALARVAAPRTVLVAGRVTFVGPDRVRVEDASGAIGIALGECAAPPDYAWVRVEGEWDGSQMRALSIDVLRAPIGERWRVHGEWVRTHQDERRRMTLLVQRAAILRAVRAWLDGAEFVEVETPSAVPSPGLDLHLDAFALGNSREPRWLITSPEYQMKRLLSGGLERIYQLCRCYRRGEEGSRHQPEFTMLEWYRALASSDDVMRDTEEMVAHAARTVLGTTRVEGERGPIELAPPWERLTVDEAFERYAGVRVADVLPDEERFFRILTETIEPELGRARPVFLIEWPSSMASLAQLLPNGRADRFEAFVDAMELCNGFGELTDPIEQRARLQHDQRARDARGLPVYPLDERFLAALEEGMPPSGGNALGVDRLVMLLLGVRDIDDVVAFSAARL